MRYSGEFMMGVCRPDLQILTLFQTKKRRYSHPFSDLIRELLTNGAWRNGCFRRLKNVRGRWARLELTLRSRHVNYPFLMKM